VPLLLSDSPTAQTSLLAMTAAPARVLNTAPGGPGLGTTAQLVPFHCSVSVPVPLSPTAHTWLVDTAATPRRSDPGGGPPGGGAGDDAPAGAVPVLGERLEHGAGAGGDLEVPDRPDVAGGDGGDTGEVVVPRAGVGAGHYGPVLAVPVLDERLGDEPGNDRPD